MAKIDIQKLTEALRKEARRFYSFHMAVAIGWKDENGYPCLAVIPLSPNSDGDRYLPDLQARVEAELQNEDDDSPIFILTDGVRPKEMELKIREILSSPVFTQ